MRRISTNLTLPSANKSSTRPACWPNADRARGRRSGHRGNIADRLDTHLEELNKNNNGEIEPDEVADRSQRYIRFIDTKKDATVSRKKLSRSMVVMEAWAE